MLQYYGNSTNTQRGDCMSNNTVSAGITILSYRSSFADFTDNEGYLQEGLLTEWESNAYQSVETWLLSNSINPETISDTEFARLATYSMQTNPQSNLRVLLNREPNLSWSAPRQNLLDGVLYFYLSDSRPKKYTGYCLKEAIESGMPPRYIDAISKDRQFVLANARHIIGMAPVTSKAYKGSGIGFDSRNFADLDSTKFHLFEHPISYDFMIKHGQETFGNDVISIPNELQEKYRREIRKTNKKLPEWYLIMQFGGSKIPFLDQKNWLSFVPQLDNFELTPSETSNPEAKVCYYFIQHLVEALQDPNQTYFEQVSSMRNGQSTGKPDYMLRMYDTWVPLEAKVAVNTEVRIHDQVKQYIHTDAFRYRDDHKLVTTPMRLHGVCLVADQYGIYLTHNGEFIDCTTNRPRWDRRQLTRKIIQEIRDTVAQYL